MMLSRKCSSILSGTATGWLPQMSFEQNPGSQAASRRLHRTLALKDFFLERPTHVY